VTAAVASQVSSPPRSVSTDFSDANGHLANWPRKVHRGVDEPLLILSWMPGGDPFVIQTSTTRGNVSLQVSRDELPEKEWFTIRFDRS